MRAVGSQKVPGAGLEVVPPQNFTQREASSQVEKKSHAASKPVSRSASYKRSGAWAVKAKNGGKFPVHKKAAKPEAKVRAITSIALWL